MQSLKDKILEGFFTNVGSDPFIYWINEVFKTVNVRYCNPIYITTIKETATTQSSVSEYKVTKAGDRSLLFYNGYSHKKPIIINISEIPEILHIKPDNIFIFYMKNKKNKTIKFLFSQLGQLINIHYNKYTYINNVLLTIDKKTGAIIDKEVIPKILISDIPL